MRRRRCSFGGSARLVALLVAVALGGAAAVASRSAQAQPAPASTEPTTAPADQPAAASTQPAVSAFDGTPYPVSHFSVQYAVPRMGPKDPRPSEEYLLTHVRFPLARLKSNGAYVVPPSEEKAWLESHGERNVPADYHSPRADEVQVVHVTLADLNSAGSAEYYYYYNSALWVISEHLRKYLTDDNRGKQLLGVFVIPSPRDISPVGRDPNHREFDDLRAARAPDAEHPDARTALTISIYTGTVVDVRTIASGQRVPTESRVGNPKQRWIIDHSPVKPGASASAVTTQPSAPAATQPSFLQRNLLDNYVAFLNRHPGRHVDVAISGIDPKRPGDVSLDYLVTETRPWSTYFQVSNTGTKDTDEWRERFGFVDNQLTNRDDILTVDYTTAAFRVSQDVAAAYDTPISPNRRVRARFYGDYDEFTASDVGFTLQQFSGEQYSGGGEVSLIAWQHNDAFLDFVAGGRYEHVFVRNSTAGVNTSGSADFAVPYLGLRFDRITDIAATTADVTLSGRFTGASQAELNTLGRLNTDSTAYVLQGGLTESFFLEPLLFPRAFENAQSTLANEIVLSLRGQYAFNYRLIPQAEEVAGGLYTVRGYPESVSSGDSTIIGSAEYRFHVPRNKRFIKKATQQPEPTTAQPTSGSPAEASRRASQLNAQQMSQFRWTPQEAYGRPDWDLILRAFVDAGYTYNSRAQSFEHNDALVGTGLGVELDVKQNISVRVDWGIPLNQVTGGPSVGESRVHVSATFLY